VSDSPHLAILASAGTGKTWRLTHRLIALLAAGVPPEQVLASTFTRKAAGEILQRLIARLVEAGTDDDALRAVNEQLAREPGAHQLDRAGARALLLRLLRQVHRLDVRTLDALFHQLARVHGWELDLAPGWRIASNAEASAMELDAIGRVLRTTDEGTLLALLTALGDGAPKRSIHRELQKLVEDGHRAWLESEAEAWAVVGHPPAPPAADVDDARALLLDLPPSMAEDLARRRNWRATLPRLRDALERQDWKTLVGLTPIINVLAGRMKYDNVDLQNALGSALQTIGRHGVHVVLRRAHERADAWRRLLGPYDVQLRALQRERRLVRFDDIPRALRAAGLPAAGEHLAFRLDGCPDHILLDEFQDTSTTQWSVLRPLVLRALQAPAASPPARSLFAVGDVKQSIFGWRDAEPRLLSQLAGRSDVRDEPLAKSRRSAPAVMRAVNRVFLELPDNAAFAKDEVLREAARQWLTGFQPHDTALTALHGAVRLWDVPAPGADSPGRARIRARAAAQLVARLAAADPAATIAVLVRRNQLIPRLILELRRLGVLASGEGGNALTDSDTVQVVLSLLVLADHPGDRAAAFHVATSPLPLDHSIDLARPDTWRAAAERIRRELLTLGYGPWLTRLRDDLLRADALQDRERQRLGQLVDLGLAWDERATLRPGDFVAHVRDTHVEEPAASRVRVLTVHAAKGLEFDAVVCAELDQVPPPGRGLLLHRPEAEGPITQVFPTLGRDIAAYWPPAAALLAAVRQRKQADEFSVLYVALTRARRRLDLLVTRDAVRSPSFAKILIDALAEDGPGPLLFEDADPGSTDPLLAADLAPGELRLAAAPVATADARPAPAPVPIAQRYAWRARSAGFALRRRAPSAREGGGRRRATDLLALGTRDARLRGLVNHAWMESITWLDEPPPADEPLLDAARALLRRAGEPVDETLLAGWLARWRAALGQSRARDLLSREPARTRAKVPAQAQPELWCERRFLVVEEEAAAGAAPAGSLLVPGAFDRVVVWRNAGAALAAEVIDFKTDAVGADDEARLAERTAHYAPQMEAYRRAVVALTGLAPAAVACRLLFLEADAVRDVS
jgi:ATP-dependent helicase/nuclease subunit A